MALNEKLNTYRSRGGKAPEEKANQPLARILIGSSALTTGVLGLAGCGPSSTEIKPTPIPETEAQPTNLVFTLAKEKQNDPDFQKLNQANTSFFQEFKNINHQNPWQLGETVALGVGNIDYALTTVVGPNGEPILGVISHLDKDGKPQSGFAINFFTNIPSDDGERAFVGIYPLKPEIYQSLLEGQTVAVDPTKDTQGPIFGFVLDKGKKWRDFSTEMTQATTEEQRQRVFSSYVDKIYLQKPDSKIHLFSLSKLPQPQQVQLVSYALATATPANIELTPTPKPSPTPQPSPTPEPTPTPIPQINVGEIQLPDPRITNPELFDLKKKEAPIPQFVNALKNAGIELSPEQIAQGITYVSTKEDGTPLVDKDGNPFVVAVYNLDPSLFPKKYRDLAGPVPLMIATKGENGWKWKRVYLRDIAEIKGIILRALSSFGAEPEEERYRKITFENFQGITLSYDWPQVEPERGRYNWEWPDYQFRRANEEGVEYYGIFHLLPNSRDTIPSWIDQNMDLNQIIKDHITSLINHFKSLNGGKLNGWVLSVVNEALLPEVRGRRDFFADRLGAGYIDYAFQLARQLAPEAILIYNDSNNHGSQGSTSQDGLTTRNTMIIVQRLKKQGLIDGVGLQMHLAEGRLPNINDLQKTIRSYQSLGVEIYVTEFDVNLANIPGSQQERLLYQADIVNQVVTALINSGVKNIGVWDIGDSRSWYNNPNADSTLFDDNGMPKINYYAFLRSLFLSVLN